MTCIHNLYKINEQAIAESSFSVAGLAYMLSAWICLVICLVIYTK